MRIQAPARKLGEIDTASLKACLESQTGDIWDFECPYRALRTTNRIILRHSRDYQFNLHDIVDWPAMEIYGPHVDPLVAEVCRLLGKSKVSAIFLANLPAGAEVLPHFDQGDFLEIPSRVHIPIKTNDAVRYRIGGLVKTDGEIGMQSHRMACEYHFAVHEIWEIDNISYHSVMNEGDSPRWHLVINVW